MKSQSITLEKLSKQFGTKVLFEEVSISFHSGNRYGLTGPNGAGKSTLLKILMGMEEANQGIIHLPERVGILKQNLEEFSSFCVRDVVIQGNRRLWEALCEQNTLYEQEMTDAVGFRLGELEEIIAEENGYSAEAEAEVLLQGLGFSPALYEMKMSDLPVDQQFSALLCQALFGHPQALLLDEPTNHLDMDSIAWLEDFLRSYDGIVLVISHDRHFLNAVTTHTADIDYETIVIYSGNYDQMIFTKTEARKQRESSNRAREKKIEQLRKFVDRFSSGTRASQVQSRLREIDRLQPEELKKSNIQRPYISFPLSEEKPGKCILQVKQLQKSFDEKQLISKLSFQLYRGDRLGIIGKNGRGKSTFIRLLIKGLEPDSGSVALGHQVKVSYFPQVHGELIDSASSSSGFEWLQTQPLMQAYDQEIQSALGKMLFSGKEAFKKLSHLSGGETARLILAKMILEKGNTLILDEPNNHLDLEAVSALIAGLKKYPETVILVSHNRDLISSIATKILAFEEDGIHFFQGTLEEYLLKREETSCRK